MAGRPEEHRILLGLSGGVVKGIFLHCCGLLWMSLETACVSALPPAGREAGLCAVITEVLLHQDLIYRTKPYLSPQEAGCKPLCVWGCSFHTY